MLQSSVLYPSMDPALDAAATIRLLKLVTIFAFGGTERQVINLATRLDPSKFQLEMACLKKQGHFLNEVEQHQIPIHEYPINSLYNPWSFVQQRRLSAYMRRQKIRIVHSYNFYANVFAIPAAKMAGVPVVIASIRDRGVYLDPVKRLVQKFLCHFADCILVNAESIREWLVEEGYPSGRIVVIRNGLDVTRYGKNPEINTLRQEFNLPADTPLVVMASRLNPQKGLEDLLHAAAIVVKRFPATRFLVVGEKYNISAANLQFARRIEKLIHDLNLVEHVIFTGYRDDIPELLSQATVAVLPSHSEGLSNSLLESMATGLPVVATDVGGTPELICDGETGLLVPPYQPVSLAQALCTVLQNTEFAQALGMRAKLSAAQNFSLERMVNDTEQLYLDLNARHARDR